MRGGEKDREGGGAGRHPAWPLWPSARDFLSLLLGVPPTRIDIALVQSLTAQLRSAGVAPADVDDGAGPAAMLAHAQRALDATIQLAPDSWGEAAGNAGSDRDGASTSYVGMVSGEV